MGNALPAGSITVDNLVEKVAHKLSVLSYRGDGTHYIPVNDQFNLDECLRYVNHGIRLFIDSAPPEGWRWMRRLCTIPFVMAYTGATLSGTSTTLVANLAANTYVDDFFNGYILSITTGTGINEIATVTNYTGATGTFEFTGGFSGGSTPDVTSGWRICRSHEVIDGDPSRYLLPADFGGEVSGKIIYGANTRHSTMINWVDEAMIRARRATVVVRGYPLYAAIRAYQPTTPTYATDRRWELLVNPQPTLLKTIEFPYIMHFDDARILGGVAESGSATTVTAAVFATNYPSDDVFNGYVVEVINGTGRGSYATVTDYDGTTGEFVVAAWLKSDGTLTGTSPGADSEFAVKPIHPYYQPAGFAYDGTVEAACLAACEIYGGDRTFDTHATDLFFKVKLPQAQAVNRRQHPHTVGRMTEGPREMQERIWDRVTTQHNVFNPPF